MIKVGSRVKFLHSTGAGIVRSIKGNLANVDVDGFEIPALLSDIVEVSVEVENAAIVRIGPNDEKPKRGVASSAQQPSARINNGQRYGRVSIVDDYEDDEVIDTQRLKNQYAKKVTQNIIDNTPAVSPTRPIIEKAPYEDTDYCVKLAFVPKNAASPEVGDLDAYIINDCSYDLYYSVAIWRNGYVETMKHGHLEADTRELLRTFSRASFAQIQTLHVSLMPFKPINYVPQLTESFDIELHPLKFVRSGNYCANDYFDEPSFIFSLTADDTELQQQPTDMLHNIKPKAEDRKKPQKTQTEQTQIEDLHIESIMESWEGLSSGEVLDAQLARFNFVMETAIKNSHKGKIVFIHGVGKGKLKYEIKKVLDRQYPKLRYQDASFAEYGYGAVMVFL